MARSFLFDILSLRKKRADDHCSVFITGSGQCVENS